MINVALIGKGYWGSKLEKYIKENQQFCLKAVCDSKSDLNKEVYNPSIDAVIVATPNQTHYPITKDAIINKKHVMCEKPLALKTKECQELKGLAEEKGVALCIDYTHTFSDSLDLAQKLIREDEIGNIQNIEMQMKQLGKFREENVYWILASHMLAVLDIFVPLKKLEFHKRDLVLHNGKSETGTIYFGNGSLKGEIFVSLNYPDKKREIIFYGDKGSIIYNPLSAKTLQVATYKKISKTIASQLPVNQKFFEFDESNNLKSALDYFYNAVMGKVKSNIKRAVLVTEVLENLNK